MSNYRIMIVEDEEVVAADIQLSVEGMGYAVCATASSGPSAIHKAESTRPDLILMDIVLKGSMDGIEAATKIKELYQIPVIFLTAFGEDTMLQRAKVVEPYGYITKPFTDRDLHIAIEIAIYKRQTDKALRESTANLRATLNATADGILAVDDKGKVLFFNQRFAELWNIPQTTLDSGDDNVLLGHVLAQLSDPEAFLNEVTRLYTLNESSFDTIHFKDGKVFERYSFPMRQEDSQALGRVWSFRDITDRQRMAEALRQSEEKYRTVANFTYDWEFWIGADGSVLYCSPSCERITGHPAAEFTANPSLFRQLVHPDDLAAYDQHRRDAETKQNYLGIEFRIQRADGKLRWLDHICGPVYDGNGQFAGTRGSNRDITQNKDLQAQAMKSRNLEALGSLAGGIAHDFNNLIQGLLGNVTLAQMCLPKTSAAFKYLQKIDPLYAVAAKLTSQLGSCSASCIARLENVNLAEYIRDVISADFSAGAQVVDFDLAADLFRVNVDPFQFRQVLKNLTTNAIEAMPKGGKLRVSAVNEILSSEGIKPSILAEGHYVKVSIQDQGCGINKEILPRIFDPYFSTKERCSRKGMGLGLSLCDTTIREHGGMITVETEPGQGSTFHIYLPAVVPASEKIGAIVRKSEGLGHRILLIEDDANVVQVLSEFLDNSGFRVDSTFDGKSAIIAFREARQAADPYAVIILDLVIPGGMDGKEIISILKEIDPEVKAIISSGYTSDQVMTNFADYGFVAACAKPYPFKEMKNLLERLI